jgi:pyrroloquinoline quinone (PQQ) biosynthesis protein C
MTEMTEWVVVADEVAIIAQEAGQFWFAELGTHRAFMPFASPMTGPGAPGSTAGLLNGAIALAFGSEGAPPCAASLPRYVFDIAGTYHNARRTPGHFRSAAKRLRKFDRPDLADYLEVHAREETGHHNLVLKDLRALGLPAERLVANLVHEGIGPLCEFFDRLVETEYPIGCIGYSYCFESTAALKREEEVAALTALWPKGIDAGRFLRTHSGIGSEASHVQDMVEFIAGLPAEDRIAIVLATYATAMIMVEGLRRTGELGDAAILARLAAAAGEDIRLPA